MVIYGKILNIDTIRNFFRIITSYALGEQSYE